MNEMDLGKQYNERSYCHGPQVCSAVKAPAAAAATDDAIASAPGSTKDQLG